MRRVLLVVLGSLLVVAAAVLRFVVVPSQARFPDDVDTTRRYTGTMAVYLDEEALPEATSSGDLTGLFRRDLPVEIARRVTTDDVADGVALVTEDATVTSGDATLRTTEDRYAIDRETMLAGQGFPDVQLPDREAGLVVGWPIGTDRRDYEGWSDELGRLVDLTFEREEDHAGVGTYVFTSSVTDTPIVDPDILATLPEALPRDVVVSLASQLDLPDALAAQFQQLLPALPDPVPLGYLYRGDTTYWVEPTTGVVVDTERTETRSVYLDVDQIPIPVPVTAVWDWSYAQTDDSVAEAVTDAEDAAGQLRLFGTWLPVVLAVLGVLALVLALVLGRRTGPGGTVADRESPTS